MTFGTALFYLFELADRNDPKYGPAAARWHARFVLKAGLTLGEAETIMSQLCGIKGPNRLLLRRSLAQRVEKLGLTATEIGK